MSNIDRFVLGAEYGAMVAILEMAAEAARPPDIERVIHTDNLIPIEAYAVTEGWLIDSTPSGVEGRVYIHLRRRATEAFIAVEHAKLMKVAKPEQHAHLRVVK